MLAELTGRDIEEEGRQEEKRELTAEERRDKIEQMIERVLCCSPDTQPQKEKEESKTKEKTTICVIENVHWLDSSR